MRTPGHSSRSAGSIDLAKAVRFVPRDYFDALDWGKKPRLGDVLYTTVGSFGIPVPVIRQEPFCFQRHVALFRPALPAMQSFLALALRSRLVYDQAEAGATGIAQKTVSLSVLRTLQLPLPPLAEQARIVVRVDELMRLCDALEDKNRFEADQHQQLQNILLDTLTNSTSAEELAANWERVADNFELLLDRPEAVDALEQTVRQLAVRGLLVPQKAGETSAHVLVEEIQAAKSRLPSERRRPIGTVRAPVTADEQLFSIPAGWAWTRLGEISINRDGERIPVAAADREQRKKIYDYYGASGVIDKIDGYLFDKTLLLIGEDGANLINRSTPIAFLAHGKYWVNNHAHVIDATHDHVLAYLALFISAISLAPYVTGTAPPKMNQAKLNAIPVALPPLEEQRRILTRVDQLRRHCSELREKLTASRAVQARLASALIEEAEEGNA